MMEWFITLQLQISIAVVVILLLRQAMKKLPKIYSYLLWLLVFARLLVPVSFETRFSFMPSEQEQEAFVAEVRENLDRNFVVSETQENAGENFGVIEIPESAAEHFTDVVVPGNIGNDFAGTIAGEADEKLPMVGENVVLLTIWAIGLTIVLGVNVWAMMRMRRLLGKADEYRRVMVVNYFTGRKKSVPVYVCENSNTPFTLGFLNPAIYLPGELTEEEQEYILCHEQVHISRKDNMVKHVAFLLTAIYWFNPFVWIAFFLMEQDMEMSCDEKVIKIIGNNIKRDYCQSLLSFAEGRGNMTVTHLTFGKNSLKQRIKNVLSYKNAKKWSVGIGVVVLVVVIVALFTTGREDSNNPIENQEGQGMQESQKVDITTPVLNKEGFESRYGQLGNYDFSVIGYDDSYYRSIMQQLFYDTDEVTKEYCRKFTNPVTAAVELLHLGEGTGSIIEDMSVSEGAKVMVAYTFVQDNSVVEIPMVLIEGTFGIWAPEGTPMREAERMKEIWSRQNEDGTVESEGWIEVTQYGIYRRSTDGRLTCLYPRYVNPKNDFHVYENILYFVVDSDYQEDDAEYQENAVAMLDLSTLQVDKNTIPLNINRTTAPIQDMYGSDGLLVLWCNNQEYHLPMVNTGDVKLDVVNTFKGKAVEDLAEREQDAYGVSLRDRMLQNPGLLLELSNRTIDETYTFIDMDGDGKTEKISLMPDSDSTGKTADFALDNYLLKIGEASLNGHGDNLHNQLYAFSMDSKEIVIALQEDGKSGDPGTHFFLYRNGKVKYAGSIYSYITRANIKEGSIHTIQGSYVIQNDSRRYEYIITPEGELKEVEREFYDLLALNDIKLLIDLPVHSAPESKDVTYIKPQTVHFTKVDKTGKWVYVEGEDGIGGWMLVGTFSWINELKKSSTDVFEGLYNAG